MAPRALQERVSICTLGLVKKKILKRSVKQQQQRAEGGSSRFTRSSGFAHTRSSGFGRFGEALGRFCRKTGPDTQTYSSLLTPTLPDTTSASTRHSTKCVAVLGVAALTVSVMADGGRREVADGGWPGVGVC